MIDISYDITDSCFFQQKIQKLLQKKCFGVIIEKDNMMTKKVAFALYRQRECVPRLKAYNGVAGVKFPSEW